MGRIGVMGEMGEKRVGLTPAQGRLLRLLREQGAYLVRLGVTGWGFSSRVAGRAWGKPLRADTVMGLVGAGLVVERRGGRGRVELHLAPEVGRQEGPGEALVA